MKKTITDEKQLLSLVAQYSWQHVCCEYYICEELIDQYADKINWTQICSRQPLSEDLIEKYKDKVSWSRVAYRSILSEPFIERYADELPWSELVTYQSLSEAFIRKHEDRIGNRWPAIFQTQRLSETFIEECAPKSIGQFWGYSQVKFWHTVSQYQKLSEAFIEKHADQLNWHVLVVYQRLSEAFIEKHSQRIPWRAVSAQQKLSEAFIEKHIKFMDWEGICRCQRLSEKFIEKHIDLVDWMLIEEWQPLSEAFIEKHKKRIHWAIIAIYQTLSEAFINKHALKENVPLDYVAANNRPDKETAIKRAQQYAKDWELEIDDQYLYAYRNHNFNGSGIYMLNVYYEPGVYYRDWHCDPRPSYENSFGLGIFPRGNTKVRVRLEDFCVSVARDDGKARVWGFEIIAEKD